MNEFNLSLMICVDMSYFVDWTICSEQPGLQVMLQSDYIYNPTCSSG